MAVSIGMKPLKSADKDKILQAINKNRAWLGKLPFFARFKHNVKDELQALAKLEHSDFSDVAIKECIEKTGAHKHSFIGFLHEAEASIGGERIDTMSYARLDATAFYQMNRDERQSIYDKAMSAAL